MVGVAGTGGDQERDSDQEQHPYGYLHVTFDNSNLTYVQVGDAAPMHNLEFYVDKVTGERWRVEIHHAGHAAAGQQ